MAITGDDGDNLLQGGYGGQVILGLDGNDVIYGDPTGAPAAPFHLVDSLRDPSAFDGAFRTASVGIGGATYLYATSIEDGGLTGWRVGAEGQLEQLFSWTTFAYAGPVEIGGRALRVVEFGGVSYLLSSGFGLSLSVINADGSLSHLDKVYDDALLNIDRPTAVTAFELDGAPYVVAAGWNGVGISVFRIDPALGFIPVQNVADAADTTLRLVADLETVLVGGVAFIAATGYFDSGVTIFRLGPGGALSRIAHDSTELNLLDDRLDGAQALASYSVGGAGHLYVGTEFGALSVYQVSAAGALTLLESLPGSYRDLQVGMVGGAPRLFATGIGREVAIYQISSDGSLTFEDSFAAPGDADAGAMSAIVADDGIYLSVARETDDGFDMFRASIGGDDEIDGGAGNDQIHGGGGADILRGGSGADLLWGDDGDDFLYGGDGADVLRGGDGDDWMEGGLRNDVLRGGAGEDRLIGGGGADTLYGGSGADALTGNNGKDKLFGGIGADVVQGGPGADRLVGNNGLDLLQGGSGADVLEGGPGADTLEGGGGDDRLKGGSGVDVLTGGAGADVFEFALNSGKDSITDFNRAVDRIEISGWTGGYGGLQIVQSGADAIVGFGNVEITVEDTSVSDLDFGAFLFN